MFVHSFLLRICISSTISVVFLSLRISVGSCLFFDCVATRVNDCCRNCGTERTTPSVSERGKRHPHGCVVLLLFGYETTKLDGAFYGIGAGNAQPSRVQSTAVFCDRKSIFLRRRIPNIKPSIESNPFTQYIYIQLYYAAIWLYSRLLFGFFPIRATRPIVWEEVDG